MNVVEFLSESSRDEAQCKRWWQMIHEGGLQRYLWAPYREGSSTFLRTSERVISLFWAPGEFF